MSKNNGTREELRAELRRLIKTNDLLSNKILNDFSPSGLGNRNYEIGKCNNYINSDNIVKKQDRKRK
jgi:hypothetical protein